MHLMETNDEAGVSGIRKWALEYKKKIPDLEVLKKDIDEFMRDFDERQQEAKDKEKLAKNEPDEEGWIKVTRTGKKKGIPRKAAIEERILEREKEKMKKLESQNFYKFQLRESKMKHLEELREKFEKDKKRITMLKAQRKFKPY